MGNGQYGIARAAEYYFGRPIATFTAAQRPIAAAIRQAGDLLGHFHAADSNRRAPGMGHVDYEEITTALHDVRYRGWLSAEVLPLPDDYSAARQAREFCLSLSNHVSDDDREGAEQ